ncbi:hypothetical protein HYS91_01265 [Candidatus Daviesbacteria bacterium]|nr:hypothetical protein [Candidatus Daviesbacteria bacterium]
MKVLIFTEGTILMYQNAKGLNRQERVKRSHEAGVQREENTLKYGTNITHEIPPGSVHDYASYIPISNAVQKITTWKNQGVVIMYLTSRRIKKEIEDIKDVLKKFNFPDQKNLYFRQQGEEYKDIVESLVPDIYIEDDCESIGGEEEMVYPYIDPKLKKKIKSIVVREFEGMDHLPDNLNTLKSYNMDSVSSTE